MGSTTHIIGDGDVLNHYEYDAFGNTVVCEEKVGNCFRYAGQQYDPVTRQYYLRARFYNPVIGRFIQEDTYHGDGLNLYSYCKNHPVGHYDPSGYVCDKKAFDFFREKGYTLEQSYTAAKVYAEARNNNVPASVALEQARVAANMPGPKGNKRPRYGDGKPRIPQDVYDQLRGKTPSKAVQKAVNKDIENLIGTKDPALGQTISANLEADHIVSMKKITSMEGFDKLTTEQQVAVLNNVDNFVGLTKTANTSKGSKSYSEWTLYKKGNIPVDAEFTRKMIEVESNIESVLQKQIDDFNKQN